MKNKLFYLLVSGCLLLSGCGKQIPDDIIQPQEMERVLYSVDELTGLIGAAALMRPSKSVMDMEVSSLKKKFKDKKFKGTRIEVDSIYLTKEDLAKLQSADLSHLSPGHEQARDIFMVGVWTAQRVSDYNNLTRDNIKTCIREIIR